MRRHSDDRPLRHERSTVAVVARPRLARSPRADKIGAITKISQSAYVTRLIDSVANEERARVLEVAIANAQYRPSMTRDGRIIPVRKNHNTKSEP